MAQKRGSCVAVASLVLLVGAAQVSWSRTFINKQEDQAELACGESSFVLQDPEDRRWNSLRIVNGYTAKPGEFPFQVRLETIKGNDLYSCGGVIMDEWHILTAAHCVHDRQKNGPSISVESDNVTARIGAHSFKGGIEIGISRVSIHHDYEYDRHHDVATNDIAILKTKAQIEFKLTPDGAGSINRICLPPASNSIADQPGESLIVAGWGRIDEESLPVDLQTARIPLVDFDRCKSENTHLKEGPLCAGGLNGTAACYGDSGGPLFRLSRDRYELVGLASQRVSDNCEDNSPVVFTRVALYIGWIDDNI